MSVTTEKSKSINFVLLSLFIPLIVILVWIGVRLIFPDSSTFLAGTRPDNVGITTDRLAPCPSSPNCVSSQSEDPDHYIQAIAYKGDSKEALNKLKSIINSQPRTKIITQSDNYLYAEFSSRWMGYVDDVEFSINTGMIDVRSASRLGESDLGVNRQRIENIRTQFEFM